MQNTLITGKDFKDITINLLKFPDSLVNIWYSQQKKTQPFSEGGEVGDSVFI